MIDYVNGYELSDDDQIAFFFFAYCDSLTFQETFNEQKRQKAMKEEINSIDRNNTWKLTELLKEQKSIDVK